MKRNRLVSAVLAGILCVSMSLAGCGEARAQVVKDDGQVTLYLTRHGKTMLNTTGRMQGWCDSPLTEAGAEVAEKLGQGLKQAGISFDAVYSSDSGRAVETAELVLKNNGQQDLPLHKNPKIREVCYGIYEGATPVEAYTPAAAAMGFDSVDSMMAAVFGGKMDISEAVTAMAQTDETKTGETWEAAQQRIMGGIEEIAKEAKEKGQKNVLVVFHGMAISTVLSAIDPQSASGELGNASITKITFDGKNYTIESVNDMSYIGQ